MSQENVEIVRRMFAQGDEAWDLLSAGNDLTDHPWLALWDPQCILEDRIIPDAASFEGRAGVVRYFKGIAELFDTVAYQPQLVEGHGDAVLVRCRISGISKAGVEVTMEVFQVFTLRNGRILHLTNALERDDALEAAGLSE